MDFIDQMKELHDKANYVRAVYSTDSRKYCPSGGMRCSYCEVVEIPDQYDENGEFVEGGSTQYCCNWTSTRVYFDDGSYEYLEMPCC